MGLLKARLASTTIKKLLFGGVVLALSLLGMSKGSLPTSAAGTTCVGTNVLITSTAGTVGTIPTNGTAQVNLVSPTSVQTIDRVIFNIDGINVLGRGVQNVSGSNVWTMIWDTSVTQIGPHTVNADVHYTDNTVCTSNPTPINVSNTIQRPLAAQILPVSSWTGPTNNNMNFEVNAHPGVSTVDLRQYMVFEWSTNIGSVTPVPTGYIGHFFSGPVAGTGNVSVLVKYGGMTLTVNIPVGVISPAVATTTQPTTNSTTATSGTNSNTTPTATSTGSSAPTTPTLTTKLLLSDPTIRQCLITSIGEARVVAIETELSRPTAAEFDKYQACFAKRSFVVASTLAPVAPTAVKDLSETADVAIANAKNTTEKVDGVDKEKLVFKGKGVPNSTVLIYVFSEPLVLATTTDSSGEWTYTLEDPLAPGNHEAYALVNKGDGTYKRSSPFDFLIGKAEASPSNPQGYSLGLQLEQTASTNNRSTNIFIASIIFIVVFSVTLVVIYLLLNAKIKSTKISKVENVNITPPPNGEL